MTLRASIALSGLSLVSLLALGTADRGKAGDDPKPAEPAGAGSAAKPGAERSRLEKEFAEALSGATMAGRWRLIQDGTLGEEKEEKYVISSAVKVAGDSWIISARVQFGDKDVPVPVPVKVLWAGDTPVISVTDLGLPGLGTYTARVMVYRGLYTGTWFGGGHGGMLSGRIVKSGAKEPEKPAGKEPGKPAAAEPGEESREAGAKASGKAGS